MVRADRPGAVINKNIYGQFAEHLGRLIYGGLWVGEGSAIPNTRGIRNDVLAALKELRVPVLRWPGGCFADEYHWRDGVGPRAERPRRPNASWGGVDTNAFGTHEFLDLCELLGADPYVNGNLGSGTPQEMMEWVEYMTSDSDSALANLRRRNGREKPWKIPYFAVGNESWGCGGEMRPEYYADEFRRYATFVKNHSGNRVQKLAVGPSDENYNWTEVLMSQAARQMDGLSLHYYTLPTGDWGKKGSATEFGEGEWHSTLVRTLRVEEFIEKHSAIMDKYDPQKRVGLMVDEWGTWYDPAPGRDMGALYQQNSMRDAVVAAVNLNIFNRHADRVKMANIAQMVNVLQSMVLTDGEKMLLTPTYHVFRMYRAHQGATLIPVELTAPEYKLGDASVPSLNASASRDAEGRLHLSLVNLDPNRAAEVATTIEGASVKGVRGEVLTAAAMNAVNTFERPEAVRPAPFEGYKLQGSRLTLSLPPKSVVMLELQPVQGAPPSAPPADRPAPREDRNSMLAHEQLLEKAKRARIDVYFEGDSITRRWGTSDEQYRAFLENWRRNFFGWNAADFGWGGDTTQNILWRLENGELDGVNPKVIVLMAGTNNVGNRSPHGDEDARASDVARGIKAILDVLRRKAPGATIVLTGVTPRNDNMDVMPVINRINENIAKFADGRRIRYVNINDRLADRDGRLYEGMANADGLHLDVKGYQVWADALKPIFTELLGPPAREDHAPPPTGDPSAKK